MEQTLQIILNAKDATQSAFNSAKGGLDTFKSKAESMQPTFQKMAVAGTVAFGAISAVMVKGISDFAAAERSQRQLEHAILDVSKGTKEQVQRVNELTTAIEKKTGMDADSINAGVAQLSTFGLQTKSVVNLTKSLADLTVNQNGVNAGAEDFIGSANMIAKALNGQFGILEKSGIRFTELQQEIIKTGTEEQKVAAIQEGFAQNLRETTDTVGGADVAMAKFKTQMGNASESIGKALLPALNAIMEKLLPLITKFTEWTEKNPQLFAKIVMVAGAIAGLVAVVGTLGAILPVIITSFTLLLGPIGLVILAIGIIGFAIYEVVRLFRLLWTDGDLIWTGIKIMIGEKVQAVYDVIFKIINAIKLVWTTVWTAIKTFFTGVWDIIISTAKSAIQTIKDFLQPIINMIDNVISKLSSIGKAVGGSIKGAVNAVGGFLGINDGIVQNGQIITTHPDDFIVATKDPSSLGGKGGIVVNINGGNYLSEYAALDMGDKIISALNMQMRGT